MLHFDLVEEKPQPSSNREYYIIFTMILACNTIVNMGRGVIPASTMELKDELGISNGFLGFLGSAIFIGLTLGSVIFFFLFSVINCKKLLLTSISFCILSSLLFAFSFGNSSLMVFSRFTSGFF